LSFYKPLGELIMKRSGYLSRQVLSALALTLLIMSLDAWAQQPAVGRKKVPVLTTDDVRVPAAQPTEEISQPAGVARSTGASKPAQGAEKVSQEETEWRERIAAAREKAKGLEREADQAELRITQLRNELGNSGQSAKYRNETAAALEETGQRLSDLRKQARAAADDVAQLEEYGKEKKYTESEGPSKTTEAGNPNDDYYRSQFEKLSQSVQDAERQAQVYENRVKDIAQHILLNGGKNGGDNFYTQQLQKDRDEAQQKLDEALAARAKAQNALDALLEEARRAGVSPGVFRP
jgi:chromosome segregation ATPase